MNKRVGRFIILNLITVATTSNAFTSSATIKVQGYTYLNNIRKILKLPKLKYNNNLSRAAQNHANYCEINNLISHSEFKNSKYFTGTNPSERALHANYQSKIVYENISEGEGDIIQSIDNLLAAIYHRFTFLSFELDEIGIGYININNQPIYNYNLGVSQINKICNSKHPINLEKINIYNICKNKNIMIGKNYFNNMKTAKLKLFPKYITYPIHKQTNIPIAFYNETPDPTPNCKVDGYPISIQFNPIKEKSINSYEFLLFNEQGRNIPVVKIDKNNDINHKIKPNQFTIIPLRPLQYDTVYHAKFIYKTKNNDNKIEWIFKTKKPASNWFVVEKGATYTIKKDKEYIFYLAPKNCNDVIQYCKIIPYQNVDVNYTYIDPNNIKLKVTGSVSRYKKIEIKPNNKEGFYLIVLP